ncbi:TetR/AcrR family transcriptional regulator [Microbacteriaceae bacterium VKM Ac-2855]|nr:TetR/AcrR family transcriptional regulator [Microbacteriaceae bacterium VKM Ac-2855]
MPDRRSHSSRAAILDAAFALVGELGYGRLSIEAIAARAGVGKQTIYRWWPSKGAVLFEAVLAMTEGVDGATGLPDTGDLEADLTSVLRATVAEFADPGFDAPLRALTAAILEDERLAADYRERLDEPTRELKRERLRSAQRAGQLPQGLDLDVAVDAIWAPLAQRWLLRTGPLTEAYADALVVTALRGLRG